MKATLFALLMSATLAAAANPQVMLSTTKGEITIELYQDKAPKTVENFLEYVRSGHYDGTIFHRVIPGFMIQGGGLTPEMELKPTRGPIESEADNGLSNKRGTVAMARKGGAHSATSQFFINHVDNTNLDYKSKDSDRAWGYTVFGKVIDGMDVVDTIAAVQTTSKGEHGDVPTEPVVVEDVRVVTAD